MWSVALLLAAVPTGSPPTASEAPHAPAPTSTPEAPTGAPCDEWTSLDREIESLSVALRQEEQGGPKLSGFILATWRATTNQDVTIPPIIGANNGFLMEDARFVVRGDEGPFSYFVQAVMFGGTNTGVLLLDAYASWQLDTSVSWSLGRMRQPFAASSLVPRNRLLFLRRSSIGALFALREQGIQFAGDFDTFDWAAGIFNGLDGVDDRYKWAGRVEIDILEGGVRNVEGAWGASSDTAVSGSAAVMHENAVSNGNGWVAYADARATRGPFSAMFEIAWFDRGPFPLGHPLLLSAGIVQPLDSTQPWDATFSWLFQETFEAAFRFEYVDDVDDTRGLFLALNRYVKGHDMKWTLEGQGVFTDNPFGDYGAVSVGLALTF